MADNNVRLERKFSLITPNKDDESDDGWSGEFWSLEEPKAWVELEAKYRVIILADAGAGKTYETLNRAKIALEQGRTAFFIRIEDINANFGEAFEVGSPGQFETWLSSSREAWFFLDSVDEARLDNPRSFEKAIRCFATRIHRALHRAHVVITSRPYDWRFKSDKELIERLLPFAPLQQESRNVSDAMSTDTDEELESSLSIYRLRPLDVEDIRQFAQHHATPDIDRLITEIERANLLEMASRPFDLEGLLLKWEKHGELSSRLESLCHIVDTRLKEIEPNRSQRQPLNQAKAREGACRLAAAVTLSAEAGILVPDITHEKVGIDAEQVLADWSPNDVRTLLERGIFNGILYGAVRFRNRDTRELLTAEWLYALLQKGSSRRQIESLLFRKQYGEQVIVPRLRPILPWLILFDESIRQRALALHPEIAVEGGDAAHLPLPTRKTILNDIVSQIVADEDNRSALDNSAILRIAQQDLSGKVQRLIAEYCRNDDVIFFLGRLVWQGNMADCLDLLLNIAVDPQRSIYTRIVSARAVSTIGTHKQSKSMWGVISNQSDIIPRRLLVELIEGATTDGQTIELLLSSVDKLPPYEKYETSGLDQAFHTYLNKFAALATEQRGPLLVSLCVGLNSFLSREPYHEPRVCRISTDFAWLMGPANHAVEMLIADRTSTCFDAAIIDILLKVPALRHWRGELINEYKSKLQELVPAWVEFNDALFWRSIDAARARSTEKGERLTDAWPVQLVGHYWQFNKESFHRIVAFIRTRQLEDDKLVALSLAFWVYTQADRPADWQTALNDAVSGNEALENFFNQLLNPPLSEEFEKREKERLEDKQRQEKERREREHGRSQWIERLRTNPEVVRDPPGLQPGDWTDDQYRLLREMNDKGLRTERGKGADWRTLIDKVGEDVASAFRDAAMKYWRLHTVELRSEGAVSASIPYSRIFALAGLEFESNYVENFPLNLEEDEVSRALRYLTKELNGFPNWMEVMYKAYPASVLESVWQELNWELENTQPDTPMHYILYDIAYYAPWLHIDLATGIQRWVENNPQANGEILRHCFQILDGGQVAPEWFAELAQSKIKSTKNREELPTWYALWVDTEPETGVSATDAWLDNMDTDAAILAAQQFITQLLGDGQGRSGGTFARNFTTEPFLTALYLMMHKYIRVVDDIERGGKGAYTPELRDHAQDARSQLFNLLIDIPGKETYVTLLKLAQSHPDDSHRPWMARQARKRAEQDVDLEPWTAKQVYEFSSEVERGPTSHRQLFDIGVLRLNDFKEWLECGNDSLFKTYQKIDDEIEMRNVVANWINSHARQRYTCAQENTLANDQRPDIWLQHPQVSPPVPIELKLLDKNWSGTVLCERLRNQLAGDYLREVTAGCGVFLLIWQGSKPGRRWKIDGHLVDVSELQLALTNYWESISNQFLSVSAINVIVVDLTMRASKSDQ